MVFWYGPVQSDKRLDRAVQSFQQSPKKATVRSGPDRGQSNRFAATTQDVEIMEDLDETDKNQYAPFDTARNQFYTIYDSYHYQGDKLTDICFYEYCSQIQGVKFGPNTPLSHLKFDEKHPKFDTLCQIIATNSKDLIITSIYGKLSDVDFSDDNIVGGCENTGIIWNDHCKVLLGLFILWNLLADLFA
jgi:hypothetical protein